MQGVHKKIADVSNPSGRTAHPIYKKFLIRCTYLKIWVRDLDNLKQCTFTVIVKKIRKFRMTTPTSFIRQFISALKNHKWLHNNIRRLKIAVVNHLQKRPLWRTKESLLDVFLNNLFFSLINWVILYNLF